MIAKNEDKYLPSGWGHSLTATNATMAETPHRLLNLDWHQVAPKYPNGS